MVRILVVEDFEEFRRYVCAKLGNQPELQIVGEASDGLEAVRKAEQLQPDVIVLDIGLPTLNGIDAARRIRELSPKSRILFVSQETFAPLAQECFGLGALGYVVKERGESELLAAVEAIYEGRQFVSKGLSERGFTLATGERGLGLHHKEAQPSLAGRKEEFTGKHEVQFYSDDATFQVSLARFVEAALGAGNPALVVVTVSHRANLLQNLQAHSVDGDTAMGEGRFVVLDAPECLKTFMDTTEPNRERFLSIFGPLLRDAWTASQARPKKVVVFGEMVAVLCAEGKIKAAIELERLWNELAQSHSCHLRCA